MVRKPMSWMAVLLGLGVTVAHAQNAPAPAASVPPPITDLQAVAVSGVQPGPGLWKVSKGDHVMWVLGVLSPLPQRMQWQSSDVAQVVAQSQQVLDMPRVKLKVDTGFFGKLFLLPSIYSARKNDDGKTLQQLLTAPTYARWLALKQQYIGNDRGIERWRPIFAGLELQGKALKKNGLTGAGQITGSIDAIAKQHGIPLVSTAYQLEIEQPRAAIKAFKASGLDDVQCFSRTLDAIQHDIPNMTARANAWATGDLDTLRKLPDANQRDACVDALTEADFARKLGINDVPARVENGWLQAARAALASNRQTFALLSMDELLSPDGYLSKLKAQGYTVETPEDVDAEDSALPASGSSIGAPVRDAPSKPLPVIPAQG